MVQPVATAEDDAFMADLLGEVDTNVQPSGAVSSMRILKSSARRKTRVLSPPISENKKVHLPKASHIYTPPSEMSRDHDEDFLGGADDDAMLMSDPMPSSPITKAVERKGQLQLKTEEEEQEDDLMEVSQAFGDHNLKAVSVNMSGSRPASKIVAKPPYPTPESSSPIIPPSDIDASTWNDVTSKLNVLSSQSPPTVSPGKLSVQDALEDDGSLRMFWTDYTEVSGSLCLFGKVKDRNTGTYVSTFVKVDNILRKLYFLPRPYRQRK